MGGGVHSSVHQGSWVFMGGPRGQRMLHRKQLHLWTQWAESCVTSLGHRDGWVGCWAQGPGEGWDKRSLRSCYPHRHYAHEWDAQGKRTDGEENSIYAFALKSDKRTKDLREWNNSRKRNWRHGLAREKLKQIFIFCRWYDFPFRKSKRIWKQITSSNRVEPRSWV